MFNYSEFDEIFKNYDDSLSWTLAAVIEVGNLYRSYNLKNDPRFPVELLKRCKHAPFLATLCGSIGKVKEFEEFINEVACERNYYAQKIIQGKLPENMHNRMIADIVSANPVEQFYAKDYFSFLKENRDNQTIDE